MEAVRQAGYTGMNVTQARKICGEPHIVARVDELNAQMEKTLDDSIESIQSMSPGEARKLITEDFLLKELLISIKLSQVASQFNATKQLIELLGKEIGMFGGSGAADNDKGEDKNKTNVIVNVLQNINKISDMTNEMVDVTPQVSKRIKTKQIELKSKEDE